MAVEGSEDQGTSEKHIYMEEGGGGCGLRAEKERRF